MIVIAVPPIYFLDGDPISGQSLLFPSSYQPPPPISMGRHVVLRENVVPTPRYTPRRAPVMINMNKYWLQRNDDKVEMG